MLGRVFWLASALGGALLLLLCLYAAPGIASQPADTNEVVISEVAWSGTAASPTSEWLELFNLGESPVDLSGWTLVSNFTLATLNGVIGPQGFYILERGDDALMDVAADSLLLAALANEGAAIQLIDGGGQVIDTANSAGGPWPAGTAGVHHRSMERIEPTAPDSPSAWISNDGITRNGKDADGQPVNGTPGMANSSWGVASQADLRLRKRGPENANPGGLLQYAVIVSNTGQAAATDVILTDTLPPGAAYVTHGAGYSLTMPVPGTLVWYLGAIDAGASASILLTVTIEHGMTGSITNTAEASTIVSESHISDNHDEWVTRVFTPAPIILIDAVYYDGYEEQDHDEAVRLINAGGSPEELSGWQLSDGLSDAVFPADIVLPPGSGIWIADRAESFRRQFGHQPDYEVRGSDPEVPNLDGTWPGYSNTGDEVILTDSAGVLRDVLVYGEGNTGQPGWSGPALEAYTLKSVFAAEGQILFRRSGETGMLRSPDTDSAMDWAQSVHDPVNGRRVRYPGWDMEQFAATEWIVETAELTIGVAPDNAFEVLRAELAAATSSVQIASHTFRSTAIASELIDAAERGVFVTLLLEGEPVGGFNSLEYENCQSLEEAGGQCWFMFNDEDQRIYDRFRYLHAKFAIIDDARVIVSTENLSPDSFTDDGDGAFTWGRRGVVIVTDAPSILNRIKEIWASDFDPQNHVDLAPWKVYSGTVAKLETVEGFLKTSTAISYSVRYTDPVRLQGELRAAVIQSPESALGNPVGILHLLASAGPGDWILAEQLSERPYWGASDSSAVLDPNPRLEAMVDAARRGASVGILLDDFFDDPESPVSNLATCQYVNQIAQVENLQLRCERANPTGLGLHNKMILAQIDDQGYVFVGSINGTELSNKGNREVALLIQSDEAYSFLSRMFLSDRPNIITLPAIFKDYVSPARHVLISEVYYDPPGPDDDEFIEIFNPTSLPLNLSGFSIGDALHRTDFEDVRRFPAWTVLEAGSPLIVAATATGFNDTFGFNPDFEIIDSNPLVPDLEDAKDWGDPAAFLQLGNQGDQVIIRDAHDAIVDAVAYGSETAPGNVSCPLTTLAGAVLERFPPWRDSNNCPSDFREWPFPNPGIIP